MKEFRAAWLGIAAFLPRNLCLTNHPEISSIFIWPSHKRGRVQEQSIFIFKRLIFMGFILLPFLLISGEIAALEPQPLTFFLGEKAIPQRWDHWQLHEGEHWSHSGKSGPNYGGLALASSGLPLVYWSLPVHSCGQVKGAISNHILLMDAQMKNTHDPAGSRTNLKLKLELRKNGGLSNSCRERHLLTSSTVGNCSPESLCGLRRSGPSSLPLHSVTRRL